MRHIWRRWTSGADGASGAGELVGRWRRWARVPAPPLTFPPQVQHLEPLARPLPQLLQHSGVARAAAAQEYVGTRGLGGAVQAVAARGAAPGRTIPAGCNLFLLRAAVELSEQPAHQGRGAAGAAVELRLLVAFARRVPRGHLGLLRVPRPSGGKDLHGSNCRGARQFREGAARRAAKSAPQGSKCQLMGGAGSSGFRSVGAVPRSSCLPT